MENSANRTIAGSLRKRPRLLRLLCTLSLINGISNVSIYISMAMGGPVEVSQLNNDAHLVRGLYKGSGLEHLANDQLLFNHALNEKIIPVSLTFIILYAMSVAGALMMYQLRKRGFHLYALAQVGIALVPAVLITANSYSWTYTGLWLVFSAVWIGLYARYVKRMS